MRAPTLQKLMHHEHITTTLKYYEDIEAEDTAAELRATQVRSLVHSRAPQWFGR